MHPVFHSHVHMGVQYTDTPRSVCHCRSPGSDELNCMDHLRVAQSGHKELKDIYILLSAHTLTDTSILLTPTVSVAVLIYSRVSCMTTCAILTPVLPVPASIQNTSASRFWSGRIRSQGRFLQNVGITQELITPSFRIV